MPKLLYIEASPRKTRSHSIKLATTFLETLQSRIRSLVVDKFDLWAEDLPRFDGEILDAKYALLQGDNPSEEQAAAWKAVTDVIDRIAAADIYVIATPMWNFGVPYKLKHLIDVVAQPGYTYRARADASYEEWGLLEGKRAVVICARGGTYPADSLLESWDFQGRYLQQALTFMGIRDIEQVALELTAVETDTLANRESIAHARLVEIADRLAQATVA